VSEDTFIAVAGMITGIVITLGIPLVIVFARRMWRRDSEMPPPSHETNARLDRIEQAIDSMAVEVERISEGQRFVTRLLAEQHERVGIPAGRTRQES
jgi:hypothetical protein